MSIIQTKYYPVEIGSLATSSLNDFFTQKYPNSKVAIVVDENTHEYCLEYLLTTFEFLQEAEVFLLPVGESNKNLEICAQVWGALSEYQFGRKDVIINLGGGMITDIGGFIASTFKRGLDFINIPTSLLGMVDASIGGKNGVNLGAYKNQIGTFTMPKAVYIDPGFIHTLPLDEIVNGYAEMLKHALIRDKVYWEDLKETEDWNVDKLAILVERSIHIKNEIVSQDEKEEGLRKILNYGHTIGHGIEGFFMDSEFYIPHGTAIAYGMICENYISMKKGILALDLMKQIENTILEHYELIDLKDAEIEGIIELMQNDKKNEQNRILSCLLQDIGKVQYDCEISNEEIKFALTHLKDLNFHLN